MKVIIILASVLGVVTNAQSLSMSLPGVELGSMSMEGIEFGTLATAAKSTKGPAAKAKAGKGAKGPVGGKGGKAASPTTSKPTTAACVPLGGSCGNGIVSCCPNLVCSSQPGQIDLTCNPF